MTLKALLRLSTALMTAAFLGCATTFSAARADTPASQVITAPPGEAPITLQNGETWVDLFGYCRVIDATNLANLSASDRGAPIFENSASQWQVYRTKAGNEFEGDVTLTACCPPLTPIPAANLCTEAGATVQAVSRAYGKNGEVDTVTATCRDEWGATYTDSIKVECVGSNTANGSAQWMVAGGDSPSGCTPDAYDTGCYAACSSTSTGIRYDSCGHPSPYNCYGGTCPPPPTPPPPPATETHCTPVHYCCGPGVCYTDCSGGSACTLVLHTGCTKSCVGSTWHTSPAPCTACDCYETNVTSLGSRKRVDSGPGCCEQLNDCY